MTKKYLSRDDVWLRMKWVFLQNARK